MITFSGSVILDVIHLNMTDAELLILDVASEHVLPRHHYLGAYDFEANYNLPNHGLQDARLLSLIVQMETQGFLLSTQKDASTDSCNVEISPHGATIWTSSRRPNWNLYISGFESRDAEITHTQIRGIDPKICWRFLGHQIEYRFLDHKSLDLRAGFVRDKLRYWLPEMEIYHIDVKSPCVENPNVDLDDYYANQFWWSGIGELIRNSQFRDG